MLRKLAPISVPLPFGLAFRVSAAGAAWRLSLLCIGLAACAPSDFSGSLGGALGLALVFGSLLTFGPARRVSHAGAPLVCEGESITYCWQHRIDHHCCPKGEDCNYREDPFLDCGDGLCTRSGDVGRCPAPAPTRTAAADEAACKSEHGSWELVCADRVVAAACIAPMPTNFTGPSPNPPFRTCGTRTRLESAEPTPGERCSTQRLPEDCYPSEAELGLPPCPGEWKQLCLGGKVEARCVPKTSVQREPFQFAAATYVTCGDGSCAVGHDKALCDRHKD